MFVNVPRILTTNSFNSFKQQNITENKNIQKLCVRNLIKILHDNIEYFKSYNRRKYYWCPQKSEIIFGSISKSYLSNIVIAIIDVFLLL